MRVIIGRFSPHSLHAFWEDRNEVKHHQQQQNNTQEMRQCDRKIIFLHGHLQFNCPVEEAYKFNTPLANLLRKNLPYKKEWISQAERALKAQHERL
jgi:hypothetical protein